MMCVLAHIIFSPSSEGTSNKPGVLDEKKVTFKAKANVILDWGLEQESEYTEEDNDDENIEWVDTNKEEEKNDDDDDKSIDLEKTDDEETDDEFMHSEEYVQEDDEETDDETVHEITYAVKEDAEKAEEVMNDTKKAELPPSGSSLSVSSGFGNQFLNLSFDTSLIGTIKDTTNAEINSLLDVQIQQEIPHIQSPSVLTVHVSVISDPSVLTPIPETPSVAPATSLLPPPTVSSISHIQLQTTTPIPTPPITIEAPHKDVQELKEVDNTTTLRASLRSEIPPAVNAYLGSSLGDALHKVLQKHTEELIQKYPQQVDYKEMIEESVQANIINEVKNQLPKFLPNVVFDFATPMIQSTVKKALEMTSLPLAQSSSQA
ncbi:hypothetical protein Tco_1360861 [Tanacetum coccineum]